VLGGCAGGSSPSGVAPDEVPPGLAGLPLTVAEIGGVELQVVVAEAPGARSRGLMGIDDFGVIDGMAFVFDAPVETGFYMKGVLVPLDIAFVGPDGTVVDVQTMPLCPAEPCPIFHAAAPFQWALETPEGRLDGVEAGDTFSLRGWPIESGAR
jgi:uncharacterized protein